MSDETTSRRRPAAAVTLVLASLLVAEVGYRAVVGGVARLVGRHRNAFVLYGIGESTMAGEPFHAKMSLPNLVSETLGGDVDGRPIVVTNVAVRGWGAYALSLRFEREVAHRDVAVPGAALIYAGHNEAYLGDDVGERPPPARHGVAVVDFSWLLRDSLSYIRATRFVAKPGGMAGYEQSLRRIIEAARAAGLVPIIATLPSNISGIEPNARQQDAPDVGAILAHGAALERATRFEDAIQYYDGQMRLAADVEGDAASNLLLYRIAHCEQALGRPAQARDHFWTVVDRDRRTSFGRATLAQNALIRRLAAEYGIPLVDAVSTFERASKDGIPGNDLFSDGQHPTLQGYSLLATDYAARVAEATGTPVRRAAMTPEEIARQFHLEPADIARAHLGSASWLLATAVYHPWPSDRMTLAETHYRAALGTDDESAWTGIALSRAARTGAFLTNEDNVDLLTRAGAYYNDMLHLPPDRRDDMIEQFRRDGVDEATIEHLRAVSH